MSETIANNPLSSLGLSDSELALLERVRVAALTGERLTQRKLAGAAGLSLGMTNILVRRFVERGWLSLRRHSTKNISYLLTPGGVAEVARRNADRLQKATRVVTGLGSRLDSFVAGARREGIESVVMVGRSDFSPLLEEICARHGVGLLQSSDPQRALSLEARGGVALVWGEQGGERPLATALRGFDIGAEALTQGGKE